ncbi:MAG: helix-turn-helix transcriptional regulator [Solirubrobacterales bacterium]|nr:helix-turn-helix transcriptional regulator [Solirubrobacterales bacterium]
MPRAGLSPNVLVDEAALLVDEHGLEALSLSALADRVGVRPPSLYKHVAGADDLRRRLSARGYRAAPGSRRRSRRRCAGPTRTAGSR